MAPPRDRRPRSPREVRASHHPRWLSSSLSLLCKDTSRRAADHLGPTLSTRGDDSRPSTTVMAPPTGTSDGCSGPEPSAWRARIDAAGRRCPRRRLRPGDGRPGRRARVGHQPGEPGAFPAGGRSRGRARPGHELVRRCTDAGCRTVRGVGNGRHAADGRGARSGVDLGHRSLRAGRGAGGRASRALRRLLRPGGRLRRSGAPRVHADVRRRGPRRGVAHRARTRTGRTVASSSTRGTSSGAGPT